MQSDFKLSSVHGMLYTGGNVAFGPSTAAGAGSSSAVTPIGSKTLVTPVLNHLTVLDLQQGSTRTHTCCNSNIQAFDVSPDGELALCVGNRGLGVFYSFTAELAIDTISFPPQAEVRCVRFSPDGQFVALALEATLQIYSCPADRVVTYHGCHRVENIHNAMSLPITTLCWTPDSKHVMVGSADAKITIFPRDVRNQKGKVLMRNHLIGHRGGVVGAFWATAGDTTSAVSVSTDNVVVRWRRTTTTRKELMQAVVKTRAQTRVAEIDGASDDEDAIPTSFMEREKARHLKKALAAGGGEVGAEFSARRTTKGLDDGLDPVLKYAYEVGKKHLLQHRGTVAQCAYHEQRQLLAIGYTNGTFAIHGLVANTDGGSAGNADAPATGTSTTDELPLLHLLSISSQSLTAVSFSATGEHVAFGSEHLKQLIVWDWRGESFLLKEQSHYYDINVTAITGDGSTILSGGEDGKVKVWKRSNGQCFASFSDHGAGVVGLVTSPSTNAFFTASKDGTCRGYDLTRYRNFRVFTPSETTQLSCLSIDPSGELLAAGSARSNVVYLWSVRTGKLVDEFTGHQGPITALAFHPDGTALTTAAVDKTLMVWKVFTTTNEGERMRDEAEAFPVDSEVLAVSYAVNGKRLAVLFLSGDVFVYDTTVATELNFITSFKTKFDAAGGWHDKTGPNTANANARFTTISMSPDGETVLCGGESRWMCLYHAAQGYLVNKWAVTNNFDFEGAEEQFNYRGMTEAGVMVGDIDVANDDPHLKQRKIIEMPGSKHAHFATGKRKTKLTARALHVSFASHGRDFIAATTGGLLVFSLDAGRPKFAPLQLRANVTSGTVRRLLQEGRYTLALIGALLLMDEPLGLECLHSTPVDSIAVSVPSIPSAAFAPLLQWVARDLQTTQDLQRGLAWGDALLLATEEPVFGHARTPAVATAIRLLHRSLAQHRALATLADTNDFLVDYVTMATKTAKPVVGGKRALPPLVDSSVDRPPQPPAKEQEDKAIVDDEPVATPAKDKKAAKKGTTGAASPAVKTSPKKEATAAATATPKASPSTERREKKGSASSAGKKKTQSKQKTD